MSDKGAGHLAKNTTYLTVASILQKLISFGYFIYIARMLGDINLGKYAFALSFASIFVIFMDFGLGPILTREGAKENKDITKYLGYVLAIKSFLIVGSILAMIIAINWLGSARDFAQYDINLVYLAGVIIILDTLTFSFYSVYRALQKLKYEAIGIMCYQVIIAAVGVYILSSGYQAMGALLAILAGSIFNFFYSLYLVFIKGKYKPKIKIDRKTAFNLLKIAAPFALAGIFFKLNGSVDTVMLKSIAGDRFVGWYNVAFKMTMALTVLPGAFATAFFPAMSYYFKHDKTKLKTIFEKSIVYLTVISLPISVGVILIARPLIITIYTDAFEASIIALQIFMASLFFLFINYPIGNFLNAVNRQTINTINMGAALLLNIVLNIFLIPRLTYIGAAISALVSTVFLVCLGAPWVYKMIKFDFKFLFIRFIKVVLACSVMGLIIYFLKDSVNLLLVIIIAALAYPALILLIKAVTIDEIKALKQSILKKA
ncbi:flippase [Patescibacteria group bacterium]|nr:flippase [Patescibacteria group bacterium]MBU1672839.1 flippase [Patescibacteria group bacterium]MBU1963263.1 flippase [Patescibacteria group bacterium]